MSEIKRPQHGLAESELDGALDHLRRELEPINAPSHVEHQLMAAFHAHHAARRRALVAQRTNPKPAPRFIQWLAPVLAIAASVGMASWMMLIPLAQMQIAVEPSRATTLELEGGNPFIALQSLERIALEPSPRLISANVPRTALAVYGMPINPENADQSVRTEMLVAANGQPLAMRFLQ